LKQYSVYILKCSDDSYYTGITNDVEHRVNQHNEGEDCKAYTFTRRPVELAFFQNYQSPEEAIRVEKKLKGWSRKKKEALIANNWEKVKELAVCRNESSHKNYNPASKKPK